MKTPWNSISESVVTSAGDGPISLDRALESPCMSCETSPCCTHLPLINFKVTNLVELDHARYLLNFERIELGISAAGDWSAYYTYPCRYLDRENFRCTVHGTPTQPQICVNYNPYNCWYKRVFAQGQNQEFVRLDRARFEFLLQYIELNEARQIVAVPAWDDLVALMRGFKDQPGATLPEPANDDPALNAWQEWLLGSEAVEEANPAPAGQSYDQLSDPCSGCSAYCCTTLVFPQGLPASISNLDYYRFCLGFPGVELAISDNIWSIVIKTRCIHLSADNRCNLYGEPQRPLICRYYDAWKCDYKPQYGQTRPDGFMRLRLEQFAWLKDCYSFDDQGRIMGLPPVEMVRQYIEQQWREAGKLPLIPLKVN